MNILRASLRKLLPGNDPSFLIVGVQKSGTTSLYYYLNQHPSLAGSKPKEVNFFSKYIYYPDHDLNWYRNNFKKPFRKGKLFFEATPNYFYTKDTAKLIRQYYPDIKIIVTLRNPVDRAFSAWNMYRDYFEKGIAKQKLADGKFPGAENEAYLHLYKGRTSFPTFTEVMEMEFKLLKEGVYEEPAIIRRGLYHQQLENYYTYFDPSQVHVIGFKDLVKEPLKTCNQALEFINPELTQFISLKLEVWNKRSYRESLSSNDRATLEDFYKESNHQLFQLLGRELNW